MWINPYNRHSITVLIGLPTSLARLPNLVDLHVKGAPDLKFPPPEIVTSGHAAVMAFLMSNMQYEDMEGLAETRRRYSVFLLYEYKSTNIDAEGSADRGVVGGGESEGRL
jgi:hypothetical protein